jgi:amino acid transporter
MTDAPATTRGGPETAYRLAKVVGVLAVAASAVSQEYGSGINYVAVQSLGVYPAVQGLVALAMFVTGLLLLPKVYLFARYGRVMPRAGSSYVWIARGLSLPVSFVVNFLWWLGVTAAMGVLAFTFGTFAGQALQGLGAAGAGAFLQTPAGHILIGLAALWLIFWLHTSGVGNYGLFVTILLFVIVATAVVIAGFGFSTPAGRFVTLAASATHANLPAGPAVGSGPSLAAFLSVCTLFVFAYGGLNAAPTLGGEARDASRTLPVGIWWAWAIALVLFTVVAAALLHAAPWWAIVALIKAGKSAVVTAPGLIGLIAGPGVGAVLNLAVAIIVGKTMAPAMMASSRTIFAWAEDHILPERFAVTSARRAPVNALLLSASLASLFLLQSALIGWSIGVVIRSFSILIVLAFLGFATLNVKWNRRFAALDWAKPLAAGVGVVVASVLAIAIAVVLMASVVWLPKTPLAFQPLFQAVVAVLIAMWVYAAGKARARAAGIDLEAVAARPPLE